MLMTLIVAVLATAIGLVYAKHTGRRLFVELQSLQSQRDEMNVEWGRLQLEQSTWATHGRIDEVARTRLKMRVPPTDAVVMVKPHER